MSVTSLKLPADGMVAARGPTWYSCGDLRSPPPPTPSDMPSVPRKAGWSERHIIITVALTVLGVGALMVVLYRMQPMA